MELRGKVGQRHGINRDGTLMMDRSIQVGTPMTYIRGKRKTHGEGMGPKRGIIREGQMKEIIMK